MCLKLYCPGRNLRIICLLIPVLNHTLNAYTILLGKSVKKTCISHNHLQNSIHITQIHEGHPAMITNIFNPACSLTALSYILLCDTVNGLVTINVVDVHVLLHIRADGALFIELLKPPQIQESMIFAIRLRCLLI